MKSSIVIIVFIVLFALFLPGKLNQQALGRSEAFRARQNEILDNSCMDAAKELIKSKDSISIETIADGNKVNYETTNLNLDAALDRFYRSMYLNMGIQKDKPEQEALKGKVPIKIATGYDGYYINSWESTPDHKIKEVWSKKNTYTMIDKKNNLKISFTLDDYVYIEDKNTNTKLEGLQQSFISKYPKSCFGLKFNEVKLQVINNLIKHDLENYTYYTNSIAKINGWKLNFNMPVVGSRVINNITFMAFYQDTPIYGAQPYNVFGFGVARVVKREKWYGYEVNEKKFYHVEGFDKTGDNPVIFDSAADAAKVGYYPDPQCQ